LHGRKIKKSLDLHSWEAAQKLVRDWEINPEGGAITVNVACEKYLADADPMRMKTKRRRHLKSGAIVGQRI
jgi:hypothetical protein